MTLLNNSLIEEEPLRTKAHEDEIRLLWDGILEILLERIHHKSISDRELTHLIDELDILMRAVKGKNGVWVSVIDIALFLLRRDATIGDLRAGLQFNESTLYRALSRLENAGFATILNSDEGHRRWTLNKDRCPILYRASRQA